MQKTYVFSRCKWLRRFLILTFTIVLLTPTFVYADFGPKPTLNIKIHGIKETHYYVTLLAKEDHGPMMGGPVEEIPSYLNQSEYSGERTAFQVFWDYSKTDDFHFWGKVWQYSGDNNYYWGTYPPDTFKVLIYLPDSDCLLVYDKPTGNFAFDSYYTLWISGYTVNPGGVTDITSNAFLVFNPLKFILYFLLRVAATLCIEMLIAILFSYRSKDQLHLIIQTNLITQILLNIALNVSYIFGGQFLALLLYLPLELIVFVLEAIVYSMSKEMHTRKNRKKTASWLPALYAFLANLCSFLVGVVLLIIEWIH